MLKRHKGILLVYVFFSWSILCIWYDLPPASSKEFLDIQATIECGFTLKRVRDMIRRYSQMHRTDKYSEHSSIIWSIWPNGWVFFYKLSGSGFESSCSHLKLSPFGHSDPSSSLNSGPPQKNILMPPTTPLNLGTKSNFNFSSLQSPPLLLAPPNNLNSK